MIKNKIILIFLFIFFIKYKFNFNAAIGTGGGKKLSQETLRAAKKLIKNRGIKEKIKNSYENLKIKMIRDPNTMSTKRPDGSPLINKKSIKDSIKDWALEEGSARPIFGAPGRHARKLIRLFSKEGRAKTQEIKNTLMKEKDQKSKERTEKILDLAKNIKSGEWKEIGKKGKEALENQKGHIVGGVVFALGMTPLQELLSDSKRMEDIQNYLSKINSKDFKSLFINYIQNIIGERINYHIENENKKNVNEYMNNEFRMKNFKKTISGIGLN